MRWLMVLFVLLPACHCNLGPNIKCVTTHGMEVALFDEKRPQDAPSCADVATWTVELAQKFEAATCEELPRTKASTLLGWLIKAHKDGVAARCTFGYPPGQFWSGNRITVPPLGAIRPVTKTAVDRAYQKAAYQKELAKMWIDGLLGGTSRREAWNAAELSAMNYKIFAACGL